MCSMCYQYQCLVKGFTAEVVTRGVMRVLETHPPLIFHLNNFIFNAPILFILQVPQTLAI